MKYFASPSFWELYNRLPRNVQELADRNFQILKKDPKYPSLHLKKVGMYWSVRVGVKHRALGVEVENDILWFWIGNHADYDKMIG
jgi:hypothetical protein